MVDNYYDPNPNIPGGHSFLKQGIKNQSERVTTGEKILLLGTALDGPVLEPIEVYDYQDGEEIYGPYFNRDSQTPNGATLTRALKRLHDDEIHNPDNFVCVRISGKHAEGELPLYPKREQKLVNERDFVGHAYGNIETELDLGVPDGAFTENGESFDDAYVEVITIEANGTPLSSDNYLIDNDNGIIIIYEGAVDSGADIIVDYNQINVRYQEVEEEVPEQNSEKFEFTLENQNLLPEEIAVSLVSKENGTVHELAKDEDFNIDKKQGILNILTDSFDPNEQEVQVSYQYMELNPVQKEFMGVAHGDTQYLYLEHTADATQPLEVLVDGEEVASNKYSINYQTEDNTVINLKPGAVRKGKGIYVSYYWNKESYTQQTIPLRSIFGGSLYNDVKIKIKDNLTPRKNRYNETVEFETPQEMIDAPDMAYRFYFPEQKRNILNATIFIESPEEGMEELSEEDYVLDTASGYITLTEEVYDPEEDVVLVGEYTYKTTKTEYVTVVRGDYNAEKNEFEGELISRASEDRVKLRHKNIVPGSLNIVITKNGTEQEAIEDEDFYVDYAHGELIFNSDSPLYPLELKDKIKAREYKYYNVNSKTLTIEKPREKSIDTNRTMTFELGSDITTISQLLTAINQNRDNNVLQTAPKEELLSVSAMEIKTPDLKLNDPGDPGTLNYTEISLRHGEDGVNLTKEEIWERLEGIKDDEGNVIRPGAYDVLMEYEDARFVVPLGVYADDELNGGRSFAQQLGNFTKESFLNGNDVFGVIGTKPLENPTYIEKMNMVERLENLNTTFFLENEQRTGYATDRQGKRIDAGLIGIVQYDLRVFDENLGTPIIESGAVNWAGIASKLSRTNSVTNETIGVGELAYKLSKAQQSRLLANKIMPGKVINGESRVVDGVTCARKGSGWETYFSVHVAFNISRDVNRAIDRYIGKGNSLPRKNSLDSDIRNILDNDPALLDGDFEIKMSRRDQLIGRCIIPLELVPIGEFRKIYTIISRNEQL